MPAHVRLLFLTKIPSLKPTSTYKTRDVLECLFPTIRLSRTEKLYIDQLSIKFNASGLAQFYTTRSELLMA